LIRGASIGRVRSWHHRAVSRGRRTWALTGVVTAFVLAVSTAGVAVTLERDAVAAGRDLGRASGEAARPSPIPFAQVAAGLVSDVSIPLPQPEPSPADPYAPTPEIRLGQLEIPSIGLSQPLFAGVTLTAVNRGPGHWPGTAMPGELGNVFVAGHRTTYTRPFWDLDLVKPGDELIFTTEAGRFVYVLERTEIVTPDRMDIVNQRYERTATLMACHPKGSARYRIVGHFRLRDGA
jgi:LPXTG-site transpeptidase (sortase) family protein